MKSRPPDGGVKWGIGDRALALFAPRIAARRYAARISIDNLRRGYEAARRGRGTEGWRTTGASSDAEIAVAGAVLRDRMRDLVRNAPMAAAAVQVLVNNIVGAGIQPRAASKSKTRNARVDAAWEQFSAAADAFGHTDFHGLTALAVREMIEGGDVFAIRRPLRAGVAPVPLQIEIKEADHLDDGRLLLREDGTRIKQGIEYDTAGRRLAYYLFPDHPGDVSSMFSGNSASVRVPADMVAHMFERQRVQSRGVPWGTPALRAIRDLDDWQMAELVRKKTEACMVGVVIGADEDEQSMAPKVTTAGGEDVEQFEPGMIAYARGTKDIKFNEPSSTSGVREWTMTQLYAVSAGFRVPYPMMTGDWSQSNFSSSRVGMNEFRRMIEQVQWHIVIPMFCQPIWDWFCEAAWTAGLIDSPTIPVEWAPQRFESINPLQDAQTDLLEVQAGISSMPQVIAKRGYSPQAVVAEQAAFLALTDSYGLKFSSDLRTGTAQAASGTAKSATGTADPAGQGDGAGDSGPTPDGEAPAPGASDTSKT
uniref:phage portal protein n=1 Tax=Paenirhodobacter enshiensis TaxID=1105367 RepID=UPI0035B4711E